MIFCGCFDDGGVRSVGWPKSMTCRKPRECAACQQDIQAGDIMYRQSFYDYDEHVPASPIFVCEECGDMALNLMDAGYCFQYNESIYEQWIEYLKVADPNNPALKEV